MHAIRDALATGDEALGERVLDQARSTEAELGDLQLAAGEGVAVAQRLFNEGFFGKDPATIIVVKRSPETAQSSIANTIQLQVLGAQ